MKISWKFSYRLVRIVNVKPNFRTIKKLSAWEDNVFLLNVVKVPLCNLKFEWWRDQNCKIIFIFLSFEIIPFTWKVWRQIEGAGVKIHSQITINITIWWCTFESFVDLYHDMNNEYEKCFCYLEFSHKEIKKIFYSQ